MNALCCRTVARDVHCEDSDTETNNLRKLSVSSTIGVRVNMCSVCFCSARTAYFILAGRKWTWLEFVHFILLWVQSFSPKKRSKLNRYPESYKQLKSPPAIQHSTVTTLRTFMVWQSFFFKKRCLQSTCSILYMILYVPLTHGLMY